MTNLPPGERMCTKLHKLDGIAEWNGYYERQPDLELSLADTIDARDIGCSHVEVGVWAHDMGDDRVLVWTVVYGRRLEGRHTWTVLRDEDGYVVKGTLINSENDFDTHGYNWTQVSAAESWLARDPADFLTVHKIGPAQSLADTIRKAITR